MRPRPKGCAIRYILNQTPPKKACLARPGIAELLVAHLLAPNLKSDPWCPVLDPFPSHLMIRYWIWLLKFWDQAFIVLFYHYVIWIVFFFSTQEMNYLWSKSCTDNSEEIKSRFFFTRAELKIQRLLILTIKVLYDDWPVMSTTLFLFQKDLQTESSSFAPSPFLWKGGRMSIWLIRGLWFSGYAK